LIAHLIEDQKVATCIGAVFAHAETQKKLYPPTSSMEKHNLADAYQKSLPHKEQKNFLPSQKPHAQFMGARTIPAKAATGTVENMRNAIEGMETQSM
jgi:hypothetical protein